MKNSFARIFKLVNTHNLSAGFTLIELLVAMSLTLIIVSLTSFGLVAITTKNSKAEARIQRRSEINRAIDFIADEVRMARRVNRTDTTIFNGSNVTLSNVVNSSGLNLSALGSVGTIVLYLEIPITGNIPATCPAGGPNAGSPPPQPSNYDTVVYDIRPNTSDWLGPQVITRYGRTPEIDGTIAPCSDPSSETFIDAIVDANNNINPTCTSPAVPSGSGGFYACVNNRQVDLYLRSKVSNTEPPEEASTKVFSRIPPPSP